MMMTHRIVLKTHPLFGDTRSLRPFDPIQQRLATTKHPEGRRVGGGDAKLLAFLTARSRSGTGGRGR